MKPQGAEIGMNRTGIGMSPIHSKEMIAGADLGPIAPGGPEDAALVRREYIAEAPPVGTVPIPTTLRGAVQTVVEAVGGKEPAVFIDKLGERLAFERTGTRLYETLLTKLEAEGSWKGGPTREELTAIHDDELTHFELIRGAMEELGADPTAMTPSADVAGVEAMGLAQVIADPRMSLAHAVHAIFTAELTDHEGWLMLVHLARALGKEEMAAQFERAREHEFHHVSLVRGWLSNEAMPEAQQGPAAKAA
jgi:rubrerythrin